LLYSVLQRPSAVAREQVMHALQLAEFVSHFVAPLDPDELDELLPDALELDAEPPQESPPSPPDPPPVSVDPPAQPTTVPAAMMKTMIARGRMKYMDPPVRNEPFSGVAACSQIRHRTDTDGRYRVENEVP
jgi:hypothetical protein